MLTDKQRQELQIIVARLCFSYRLRKLFGTKFAKWFSFKTSVLLCGGSATTREIAINILVDELQLKLSRIDLAGIVSKYIGETEKNLAKLFDRAERANTVLLFDEADALFGKRTVVRATHDRYTNLETGYLLQRIETYKGVVILSTNLIRNIDKAMHRRADWIVEFSK